jgi:hypothetical protein
MNWGYCVIEDYLTKTLSCALALSHSEELERTQLFSHLIKTFAVLTVPSERTVRMMLTPLTGSAIA